MDSTFKMRLRKGEGVSKKGPMIAKHSLPSSSVNSQINSTHNKETRSPVGPSPPILGYNRRRQLSPDPRISRRNQQSRGSPKESPKTSPTRNHRERSNSPTNHRRHAGSNRYNLSRPGARTPPSPTAKRYTPPTSPKARRQSPTRVPQSSPTLTKRTGLTPMKCFPNPAVPSSPPTQKAVKKPPSPANSRPSSPGNRRPASPRGTSPRGRGASPGSKPPPISEEDLQIRVQRAHKARLYFLHKTGPNSFSVGSDAPNHKYKVIIGPQTCSCGHGPYCVHVLFVMVRVLQLSDNDPLLMTGSLKDYEVEQLLRSWESRREKAIHARERRNASKDKFFNRKLSRNGRSPPGSPTRPSPGIADADSDTDAQCPICLMTMVSGEHLVSCDAGCQNFLHHHCMSVWAADRHTQAQPLLCPLCRAPWSPKSNARLAVSSRERKNSFVTTSPTNSIRRIPPKMSASFSGAGTHDKRKVSSSSNVMSRSLLAYPQSSRTQAAPEYPTCLRNLVPDRFTNQCYPPTVRGEISAALVHNTAQEMVLLPHSEPIPEELVEAASSWVNVFGNELIACLYSRDWAVRETGLRRLAHEVVKVLRWDYLVTTEEMRQKVVHCCANILAQVANDPVYKVYIACLRCVKLLLAHLSPTEESEVTELQNLLRPLIHTLLLKCADGNRRTSQISIDFLIELARGQSGELALATQSGDIVETLGLGAISYVLSCLIEETPPSEAPWQWRLGRLCVLDRLLDEFPQEFQLNLADPYDKHFKIRHYDRLMTVVEFAFKALGSNHATVSKLARRIYICSARMAILQPAVFNQICGMLAKLDMSLQMRLKRRLLSIHTHGERKGSLAKLNDKMSMRNSQGGSSSHSRVTRSVSHSPSRMLSALRSTSQSPARPELFVKSSSNVDETSDRQSYEKPSSPKRPTHLPLNSFDVKFKEKQAKLRLYHKTRPKQEVPLLVQHALLSPGAKGHQMDMQQLTSILKGEESCNNFDFSPQTPLEAKYKPHYFIKDAIGTPGTPTAPYSTPVTEQKLPNVDLTVSPDKEKFLPAIPGLDLIPKYLDEDAQHNEQSFEASYIEGRDWAKGPLLGTGAFSSCFQARDFLTGTIMAVKQLSVSRNSEEEQEKVEAAIEEEILMMSRLRHKNVIRLFGATRINSSFSLFSEWMAGGSVAAMLDRYGPFSESVIIKYTKQVLQGLLYLHDNMILHRDLKGANLLIDSTGQTLRIGDFGTAARLANKSTITGEFQGQLLGTIAFMAPEVLKGEDYGRACDIWSVGCCIIEMATTKPPWGADNVSNQYKLMFRIATSGTPPPIPESLSHETQDIALKCLQIASVMRPSAKALLNHRAFDLEPP